MLAGSVVRGGHTAIVTLALLVAGSASAQDWSAISSEPQRAQGFDYCAWAASSAKSTTSPPDFEAQIKDAESGRQEVRLAALILASAGVGVASEQKNEKSCRREFKRGEKLYRNLQRREQRRLKSQAGFERSADADIALVQTAISQHWLADQVARAVYLGLQKDANSGFRRWARQRATAQATLVDATATAYLKQLLERYDWIDRQRFGPAVSQNAWLLVQHADDHPHFQSQVLERMSAYLDSGGIKKANYAYLWDRVAVNSGRPQRYGTQPIWECHDGKLDLQPLAEPEQVNQRRAEMGMDSVESGLAQMSASVCR